MVNLLSLVQHFLIILLRYQWIVISSMDSTILSLNKWDLNVKPKGTWGRQPMGKWYKAYNWSLLGWEFDNCTMLQGTHGGKFDMAAIEENAENLEN